MRRSGLRTFALAVGIVALAGCSSSSSSPSSAPANSDGASATPVASIAQTGVIKIGAVSSKTGTFARQAELMQRGYDLFAEAVNAKGGVTVGGVNYKVEIVYYDDQGKPETATSVAERLITEDHVDFLLGPFSSGLTLPVGAIAEKYKKVFMGPGGNSDKLNEQGWKYYFGIGAKGSTLSNPFIDMLKAQATPPQTIALVSSDDLFGQTQRVGLSNYINASGSPKIVFDDVYPLETKDFSTLIGKISGSKADVIVQIGDLKGCTTFLSQLQELGYQPKAYSCAGPSLLDLSTNLKAAATNTFGYGFGWDENVPWCDKWLGCAKEYVAAYKAKYNELPSYQPVNASAAGVVLLEGIVKANSIESDAVRDAVRSNKITVGAGPVDYDETGLNTKGTSLIQQLVDIEKVVTVWPADRAVQPPVYPIPAWK